MNMPLQRAQPRWSFSGLHFMSDILFLQIKIMNPEQPYYHYSNSNEPPIWISSFEYALSKRLSQMVLLHSA
jgi:hypothetical protein